MARDPEATQELLAQAMGVDCESSDAPQYSSASVDLTVEQAEYVTVAIEIARAERGLPDFAAWKGGR